MRVYKESVNGSNSKNAIFFSMFLIISLRIMRTPDIPLFHHTGPIAYDKIRFAKRMQKKALDDCAVALQSITDLHEIVKAIKQRTPKIISLWSSCI